MNIDEKIKRSMKQKIIDNKNIGFSSMFFWWTKLDYKRKDSHVEHQILAEKVATDFKKIKEAKYLISVYKQIGVDFKDFI